MAKTTHLGDQGVGFSAALTSAVKHPVSPLEGVGFRVWGGSLPFLAAGLRAASLCPFMPGVAVRSTLNPQPYPPTTEQ